ncbi:MAG: penicillin-binding protein 2 [Patescibacteria group bacterium]
MRKPPFFIVENIESGRKDSLSWVEESFGQDSFSGEKTEFLSLSLSEKKLRFFLGLIFLGLAVLLGKSFYLQVVKGGEYFSLAENNRIRTHYVKAQRGIVFDREGQVLVKNLSGFSLLVMPSELPKKPEERQKVLDVISQIAGVTKEEIAEKIKEDVYYYQPQVIKTGIGYEKAMALKILSADLPGVSLEVDSWRQYVFGSSLSQILGYVGKINEEEYSSQREEYLLSDNIGKTGLEKYYEKGLKGVHGRKKIEVDALGREKKIIAQIDPVNGSDLVLALDVGLQNKIYQVLEEKFKGKKSASVIVSNPQNGEILALVDYPSYDNNLFAVGISQADYQKLLNNEMKPLFMKSIAGEFPSGSTIKPVIASAGLQEKVVTPSTSFNSTGGLRVGQWFFPDWKSGGHGLVNIHSAIAQSVNTYFYYLGGGYGDFQGLGVERLAKYLKLFGAGEILGIDLPGERSGFVPSKEWKEKTKKEVWYIGDTYHLSIGQGDLTVTPLQINSFTSTIANGGKIYVPHVLMGILNPDGTKEAVMPEILREDFIDAGNLKAVRDAMRQAVTLGSARSLNVLPVEVAGKTGTAQWNTKKPNHAWFTGFAPFNDPDFCITVLVEQGGEGSSAATPVAKEVMEYWFNRQN